MKQTDETKRCIDCNRTIRKNRKINKCSSCIHKDYWKAKYDELKSEFEKHKILYGKVHADLWKRLKKHEPELTWDEDPN